MGGCGCGSVVRLLADYLERQLPPALQQELEAHLQRCPHCVTQLRTYQRPFPFSDPFVRKSSRPSCD